MGGKQSTHTRTHTISVTLSPSLSLLPPPLSMDIALNFQTQSEATEKSSSQGTQQPRRTSNSSPQPPDSPPSTAQLRFVIRMPGRGGLPYMYPLDIFHADNHEDVVRKARRKLRAELSNFHKALCVSGVTKAIFEVGESEVATYVCASPILKRTSLLLNLSTGRYFSLRSRCRVAAVPASPIT